MIEAQKKEYIEREKAINEFAIRSSFYDAEWGNKRFTPDDVEEILRSIPVADVVDGETYRELLKVARKMHRWIILNTSDELEAYDECGLVDEMNALLGYGGQFTAKMDGGVNDGKDDK